MAGQRISNHKNFISTRFVRILFGVLVASFIIWLAFGIYGVRKLETFRPRTFNDVLESEAISTRYGLKAAARNPADYGYVDFSTHTFSSLPDGIMLEGWHVPAKHKTETCILFVHGRGSNRLRTLKYLDLIRDNGLDQDHGAFFLDLRSSGGSGSGPSAMGFEASEDIASTIEFLQQRYDYKIIQIYAFSMGAMATQVMFDRADLRKRLQASNVNIDRLIFDSPLVNMRASFYSEASRKLPLPGFMFSGAMLLFDARHDFSLERMRLSTLRSGLPEKLLIMQTRDDPKTVVSILKNEIGLLAAPERPEVHYFATGMHVRAYQNPRNHLLYTRLVGSFLK